ncbi:MAG: MOSC domain-containing protein [Planctomycetes bacterium]|nr:MOSC domain-containing protein [Planctomycetota bacterium]
MSEQGRVVAVARDDEHRFSKPTRPEIELLEGIGVVGDVHAGETVKHRSRVSRDPTQPNLRQVHLIHTELFDEVAERGFTVGAGDLGENIATRGIALLDLPTGTRLEIGASAVVEVTGLRNPCGQIDRFQQGLLAATLEESIDGRLIRKAGVMAIVVASGAVRPGDRVVVRFPSAPYQPLVPV